ncbi:MAG: PAS domain-containing sensor histidine kinase [Deltaproteobacteria bacterium]|nr:PAS domain-containing sensor histidine kinase [Deltaproteobacteria bacterium]
MDPHNTFPDFSARPGADDAQAVDRIPTRTLLEALARIYEYAFVTDSSGRVLWRSEGLVELCGGEKFRVGCEVKTLLHLLPGFPRPEQAFELRSRLRRDGFLTKAIVELSDENEESIPIEVNVVPVSDQPGERPFYVVIARPADSEKPVVRLAEQSPGGSVKSILDDAPDAILAVDARGFVVYANAAVERLVGHSGSQIVDRPVAALLHDAADLERLVSSIGVERQVSEWELTLTRSDGRVARIAASARSRTLDDGTFDGTVLCLRDITDRHQAATELSKKNAELEHCISALAHDLRSPLVGLLGFSRLLRQDYGNMLDDTGTHFVDRIEQAGRTMEDLIHDLLELSRIGQPGERKALVNPASVLYQLHAELKPRLESAGIELELPHDPPLVYCDRTRLYQVFSNLIGNAIDHMGTCDEPRIAVSIFEEEDVCHIAVRDSGCGIDSKHHEQVFEAFQSLGPPKDGRTGAGIGLAIVKKIAEMHGGRVWLDSSSGCGTTFHVTFLRPST